MLCSHEQEVCEQLKWSLSGAMMNVCVMYECVCMYIYVCLYVGRYACIYAAGKGSINMCVCTLCESNMCIGSIDMAGVPVTKGLINMWLLGYREYVYCVHFCVNPNAHIVSNN